MITEINSGPLLVQAHATMAGQLVIEVTLNAPEALNALNVAMVDLLLEHVPVWEADDTVIAIIMRGSGSKSFCAGRLKFSLYSRFSEQARAAFYPCSTRKVRVLITLQEALALAYQDTDF